MNRLDEARVKALTPAQEFAARGDGAFSGPAGEEALRRFVEEAPTAMAMFDRELHYVDASPWWRTHYRLGRGSIRGRAHDDSTAAWTKRSTSVAQGMTGTTAPLDDCLERPDGSTVWLRWHVQPWYSDRGVSGGFIVAAEDISQQKSAEAQLRESGRRLAEQRLLASVGAALNPLDPEQALVDLVGVVVRELGDYGVLFLPNNAGRLRRVAASAPEHASDGLANQTMGLALRAFAERKLLVTELVSEARADAPKPGRRAVAVPLLGSERCLGVFALASAAQPYDEDDQHLVEEVAHRVALFVQSADAMANELAARRMRDQVLAVVANDLRGPLNAIRLQAHLLSREDRVDEWPAGVESIRRNATRMSRLMQDLLDAASLELGQLGLKRERVATNRLLTEVVAAHRLVTEQHAVELQSVAADDVWADRERLLQVFENLLAEAVKHATGTVKVRAQRVKDDMLFSLSDGDASPSAGDQQRLFERFWQAQTASRDHGDLALTIAKGIVEAHGGRLWGERQEGHDAFFFTLPVIEDAREPTPDSGPPL